MFCNSPGTADSTEPRLTETDALALLFVREAPPAVLDTLEQALDDALGRALVLVFYPLDLGFVELARDGGLVGVEEADGEEVVLALVREAVQAEQVRRRVHVRDERVRERERRRELPDGDLEVERREDGRRQQLVRCARKDLGEVHEDSKRREQAVSELLPRISEQRRVATLGRPALARDALASASDLAAPHGTQNWGRKLTCLCVRVYRLRMAKRGSWEGVGVERGSGAGG